MPSFPIFLENLHNVITINHMPESIVKHRSHLLPITIQILLIDFLMFIECILARHPPYLTLFCCGLLESRELPCSLSRRIRSLGVLPRNKWICGNTGCSISFIEAFSSCRTVLPI